MHIVKYAPHHLELLLVQPAQAFMRPLLNDPAYAKSLANEYAYTAAEDGHVYGCGGALEMWNNRAVIWALLSGDCGKKFTQIHRTVVEFINRLPHRRIETTVDSGFEQGHRWVRLLGFEYEGTMRGYTPEGADCDLYAIVRQ